MNEHLILTNVEGKRRLRILDTLEIDHSLPKHKDAQAGVVNVSNVSWATVVTSNVGSASTNAGFVIGGSSPRPSILSAIWSLLRRGQIAAIESFDNARAVSPIKTFEAILGGGKKLKVLTTRLDDYAKSIDYAKTMGQTALADQLTARLPIIQSEAILVAGGYTDYIEEETLIDFALKCEKGLRLDYIRHFTRLIPHAAQIRKVKMDELRVFDNYAILHFDPANKSAAMTKAEIEKKKDPILFGLLKDSPRLYHVASWQDEYCNLTFDDLIEQYGDKATTLN